MPTTSTIRGSFRSAERARCRPRADAMALTIPDLEKRRQNFYTPAFNVLVGHDSLVHTFKLEVASVQVDLTLTGADRFTFVINNAFDIEKKEFNRILGKTVPEFFELGRSIDV